MILFTVSASAIGKNILKGEKLSYDDVLLALGLIEQYHKSIPVSVNITSQVFNERHIDPHKYIDVVLYNEFMNGARRPHLVYLEEGEIKLPSGKTVYKDKDKYSAYHSGGFGSKSGSWPDDPGPVGGDLYNGR